MDERNIHTNALLDYAATSSCAAYSLIQDLGIDTWTRTTTISSFDLTATAERERANFRISHVDGSNIFDVRGAIVGTLLTTERDYPPTHEDIEGLDHLEGVVSFVKLDHTNVELILGALIMMI